MITSRKGFSSVEIIFIITFVLIAFAVSYFVFFKGIDTGREAMACQGQGGILTNTCNDAVAYEIKGLSTEDDSCCFRIPGADKEEFDDWVAQVAPEQTSQMSTSPTGEDEPEDIDYSTIIYSSRDHRFPEENFQPGTSQQDELQYQTGKPYFIVNGERLARGETAQIATGNITVSAVNMYTDMDRCSLGIQEILNAQEGNLGNFISIYEENTCGHAVQLQGRMGNLQEGARYKLTLRLEYEGELAFAPYAFIEYNTSLQPQSYDPTNQVSYQLEFEHTTFDIVEDEKELIFSYYTNYPEPERVQRFYTWASSDKECEDIPPSAYTQLYSGYSRLIPQSGNKLCLVALLPEGPQVKENISFRNVPSDELPKYSAIYFLSQHAYGGGSLETECPYETCEELPKEECERDQRTIDSCWFALTNCKKTWFGCKQR